jgi:hypothetical protein
MIFGFILAIGITLTNLTLLLVRVNLSAGQGASGLLGRTGTAFDFLVWMGSAIRAISRSSLFSSLSLHLVPNLANLSGMECKS